MFKSYVFEIDAYVFIIFHIYDLMTRHSQFAIFIHDTAM